MKLEPRALEGASVRLEPLGPEHCSSAYVSWFNDPEVCRDNRHGVGYTEDKMRAYVASLRDSQDTLAYAVIRKADGKHVGNAALNSISGSLRSAEISILIGERSAWGGGLGTEACRLLLDHAFGALDLHRVFIGATARNAGMAKIAARLGMAEEGVLRDAFHKDGAWHDIVQWSVTNPKHASALRVVVLSRYGNLMGLEYLKGLREAGIRAHAVVFEGDSYAEKDRAIVAERTQGLYTPLSLEAALGGTAPPIFFTKEHNSEACAAILRRLDPGVLVLGGTAVLKESILGLARKGALNCHPGILPGYRGCSCVEWAVLNDDPVGATCHVATAKIDSGPIVHQALMPVRRGDSYAAVRARMMAHQRDVMVEGLRRFLAKPDGWPEPQGKPVYHRSMAPENITKVREKLERGTYKHAGV